MNPTGTRHKAVTEVHVQLLRKRWRGSADFSDRKAGAFSACFRTSVTTIHSAVRCGPSKNLSWPGRDQDRSVHVGLIGGARWRMPTNRKNHVRRIRPRAAKATRKKSFTGAGYAGLRHPAPLSSAAAILPFPWLENRIRAYLYKGDTGSKAASPTLSKHLMAVVC